MLVDGTLEKEDIKDGGLVAKNGIKCDLKKAFYKMHHIYSLYGGDEYMVLMPHKKGHCNNMGDALDLKEHEKTHIKIDVTKELYCHIETHHK